MQGYHVKTYMETEERKIDPNISEVFNELIINLLLQTDTIIYNLNFIYNLIIRMNNYERQ